MPIPSLIHISAQWRIIYRCCCFFNLGRLLQLSFSICASECGRLQGSHYAFRALSVINLNGKVGPSTSEDKAIAIKRKDQESRFVIDSSMKQDFFATGGSHKAAAVSPVSTPAAPRTRVSRNRESLTKDTPNDSSSPGAKARPRAASAAPASELNCLSSRKPVSRRLDSSFRDASLELQRRLETSEGQVRELQAEVVRLKTELQRVQGHCCDVEAQKKRMADELLGAQERIKLLERNYQEARQFQSRVAQNCSINDQLEQQFKHLKTSGGGGESDSNMKVTISEDKAVKTSSAKVPPFLSIQNYASATTPPVPQPPPPPPARQGPPRTSKTNNGAELVELYNSLTKHDVKRASAVSPAGVIPHHGIVGELQNRSSHLLAIKSDVETRGDFISHLIARVQSAAYSDMEDVLNFVDWLDKQLSTLSDETAVLKHFNWPERKADALREAAIEYKDLRRLQLEASSFQEDKNCSSLDSVLRKITTSQEKLEKGVDRLAKLRSSAMLAYKDFKIPTDWMLETGLSSKMKLASINLAKVYMNTVLIELDTARNSVKEMSHEALLVHSVRFAYRVHQLAGCLDAEAICVFNKLRERVRT